MRRLVETPSPRSLRSLRPSLALSSIGSALLVGLAFPLRAAVAAPAAALVASSDTKEHPAAHAFDGLLRTAWAEAQPGEGEGSWVEVDLGRDTAVESVSLWPGNLSDSVRTIREYGRPMDVTVTLIGGGQEVTVTKHLLDPGEDGPYRIDIDVMGTARKVRVTLDKVYPGGIHSDAYLAEVAVNFARGAVPASVQGVRDHLATDKGKAAVETSRTEVVALFERCSADPGGDRQALQELMERAAEGPPFLRELVLSKVEPGFRAAALTPDEVAIDALLKIKDSNAIPAIERAGLRLTGTEARRMAAIASKFRAYQDLVGGPSRNVTPYGETGWAEGQLQGMGEPLAIEVDAYGAIFVADVGNHRVQRFNQNGVVDKVWCAGKPDVTDRWFEARREFYVAGCVPGDADGAFVNPVDLALFPGKVYDTLAVLDASGRVTLIGEGDRVVKVIRLPTEEPITAGMGGEGYVLNVADKIVVIWSNEGFVFDREGEEKARFEIEAGAPTGAVALGGKIGLIHGKRLDLYSLDGFYFGDVVRDAIGGGFEAWDVTLDEKGRLWAVTDKGEVFKLRRPSKAAWGVQISDVSLQTPRIDVIDGMAYVTDRDHILKRDLLELEARARQAAKDAAKSKE